MSILEEFKQLPIWKEFSKKNTDNYNVDELASKALSLLDLYYQAFPKYTLHNRQHQKNILKIIGELLGDEIEKLTSLECAIIILSVFYHDIGMVFNKEQLRNIENEESFNHFLNSNYKAKLIYQESQSSLNEELAEWYCRWMHAQRVWLFLDDLNKVKWGTISLRESVGNVCESHNHDVNILNDDQKFSTEFLSQADLRFCAILLRLGDILDFDNSRTPKSVYEFLELDNPNNRNEKISSDEWKKHLCSDGFRITSSERGIDLKFIAGPEHPQIEKNIQTFLDVIEDELKKCSSAISKCSKRWRDFQLPLSIDRRSIQSLNYKKGDYRLSLDENQIIKLLIGENLYDNELVFIRELLQNAIDTSRMREYHELSNGNHSFKSKPIEVSTWTDNKGYRWIRVDDFGMGINEYIVTNHLLKKGNSYYTSDYFKIQKMHFKKQLNKDFTPISRFGIGLLSCFILGDTIEINTKAIAIPQTNSEEEKIRLSIQGIQSQYYMQTEKDKHKPLEMPNQYSDEEEFRKDFGTSIAIRINRSKDDLSFEKYLNNIISYYVSCTPIEIIFLGRKLGVDFNYTLNTPLSKSEYFPFTKKQKGDVEDVIEEKITSEIGVEVLALNITSLSKNNNLKGQIVLLRLRCDYLAQRNTIPDFEITFAFENQNKKYVRFIKKIYNPQTNHKEERKAEIDIQDIFEKTVDINNFNKLFLVTANNRQFYNEGIQLVHNGINVPNFTDRYSNLTSEKLKLVDSLFSFNSNAFNRNSHMCFGIIYLQDRLMPELSVARNIIKRFSFSIYSSLFYSTKELNQKLNKQFYNYIDNVDETFTLKEIKDDDLIKEKIWDTEKLILTENGLKSVNDVKKILLNEKVIISAPDVGRFVSSLVRGLIQINFNVEFIIEQTGKTFLVAKSIKNESYTKDYESIDEFYPLLFVPFNNTEILANGMFINNSHMLIKWMLVNQDFLIENFNGYFTRLIRYILDSNIDGLNILLDHLRRILPDSLKPNNQLISKSAYIQKESPPF